MKFIETKISELIIVEPTLFVDARGYFLESYNQKKLEEVVGKISFVQDNESKSYKGVLRGLHFQKPPFDQAKLVRCIDGEVLDVVVDIRKNSEYYGKYFSIELSDTNNKQLFVPKGFAHGFVVLSKLARVSYKVDNYYNPISEEGLNYNDPQLNIDWKIKEKEIIINSKDCNYSDFNSKIFFK